MTSVGAMIMSVFGAVWWIVGAHAFGRGSGPLYAVGVLITLVIVVAASRSRIHTAPPEGEARRGRLVGIASGAEGVMILVAVNVLRNIGKSAFIAPVVAIIIGLHFLPLARWLPAPLYYGTGAALILIGGIGGAVDDEYGRILLVSFSSAAVLWLTAIAVLMAARLTARTVEES